MSTSSVCSFLQDISSHSYGNIAVVTEIGREDQLLQQEKADLKSSFIYHERMRRYCEYLSKEQVSWPSKKETEESLKASRKERREVKDELEEETEKVEVILQTACTEYEKLKEKVKVLEEKQNIFENKKATFESRLKVDPKRAHEAVDKCQQCIDKLEAEILRLRSEFSSLESSIVDLKAKVSNESSVLTNSSGEQIIKRTHKVLAFLEMLTGVRQHKAGPDEIYLEFLTSGKAGGAVSMVEDEDFSLFLTISVQFVCHGDIRITDVKINVDHFNIKDIVDVALATNDIPYLVRSVQDRWLHHFPLLSEIDILNKHHAVDWIQEQSRLRVLVGKCGKIMLTLSVPKDYPVSRGITLLDSYGIGEENGDDRVPDDNATLLEWVIYLENKYGDCD